MPDDINIFKENLKVGSRGDQVKLVQSKLKIKEDGIFGPDTLAAVKRYQVDNQLTPDGIVGERTWRRMFPSSIVPIVTTTTTLVDPQSFSTVTRSAGPFTTQPISTRGATQINIKKTLDSLFKNKIDKLKENIISYGLDISNYLLPDEEVAKNFLKENNPSLTMEDLNIMVYGVAYNPTLDIAGNIEDLGKKIKSTTDKVKNELEKKKEEIKNSLDKVQSDIKNELDIVQLEIKNKVKEDLQRAQSDITNQIRSELDNAKTIALSELSNSRKYDFVIEEKENEYEVKVKYKRLDKVTIDIGTKKIPKDYKEIVNGVKLAGKENLKEVLQNEAITKGYFGFLKEDVRLTDSQVMGAISGNTNSTEFTQNLKVGSKGEQVKQIQTKLKITVDGIFGPQTLAAVKNFQAESQLTPDGIVGEKTWRRLFPPSVYIPLTESIGSRITDPAAFRGSLTTFTPVQGTANSVSNSVTQQANDLIRQRADSFANAAQAGASASALRDKADEATERFEELKRFSNFSPFPITKDSAIYKNVKKKKDEMRKMIHKFVEEQQALFDSFISSMTQTSTAIPAIALLVSAPPFNIPAAISLASLVMSAITELVSKVSAFLDYVEYLRDLVMFVSKKAYQELVRVLNPMIEVVTKLLAPIGSLKKFIKKIMDALKKLFTSKNCEKQLKKIKRELRRKEKALRGEKDKDEKEDIEEEIKEIKERQADTIKKCSKGLPMEQDIKDLNQVLSDADIASQELLTAVENMYVYDVRLPSGETLIGISDEELDSLRINYNVIFSQ